MREVEELIAVVCWDQGTNDISFKDQSGLEYQGKGNIEISNYATNVKIKITAIVERV